MKLALKQEGCFSSWQSGCSNKVLWPWDCTLKNYWYFCNLYMSSGVLINSHSTNSWEQCLKSLSRKGKEIFSLVWNFLTLGVWDAFKYKNHVYSMGFTVNFRYCTKQIPKIHSKNFKIYITISINYFFHFIKIFFILLKIQ